MEYFDGEEINRMEREQGGNGKGDGLYDYLLRAYNINEEKMRKKSERKAVKLAREKNKKMRFISGLNGKHEKENWRGMNVMKSPEEIKLDNIVQRRKRRKGDKNLWVKWD